MREPRDSRCRPRTKGARASAPARSGGANRTRGASMGSLGRGHTEAGGLVGGGTHGPDVQMNAVRYELARLRPRQSTGGDVVREKCSCKPVTSSAPDEPTKHVSHTVTANVYLVTLQPAAVKAFGSRERSNARTPRRRREGTSSSIAIDRHGTLSHSPLPRQPTGVARCGAARGDARRTARRATHGTRPLASVVP